jgi:hypothetical protein
VVYRMFGTYPIKPKPSHDKRCILIVYRRLDIIQIKLVSCSVWDKRKNNTSPFLLCISKMVTSAVFHTTKLIKLGCLREIYENNFIHSRASKVSKCSHKINGKEKRLRSFSIDISIKQCTPYLECYIVYPYN